jgi:transketolase
MDMVAVEDVFGESGTPAELLKKYGLDSTDIAAKARQLVASKEG